MNGLLAKIKRFPDAPGIYMFFNSKKELIYVGKATSLRDRVGSYFRGVRTMRPIEQMIHQVVDIKYQQTDSVLEAVIMEGRYIKQFRPKYNIDWKDDKSWNYIVINKDDYPRINTLREHEFVRLKNCSQQFKYVFGPYPGLNTAAILKILRKIFVFSSCRPGQGKPCFYRQIGECLGVCSGEISPKDYRQKAIRPLVLFLSGKKKTLLRVLEIKMRESSKERSFEEAARLRDQIKSLRRIQDVALLSKNFFSDQYSDAHVRKSLRIEGYDISNLGAQDKVGSMVVFDEAGPVKSDYRKFNIKKVVGQSDVDCLSEIIARRIQHFEWPLPDIFLVDGGLPQVNAVYKILFEHKIKIPVVGIAKGPTRRNNVFIVKTKNKRQLSDWITHNRNLLIRARDEAHRFAIAFNRSKRILSSRLF